MESLDISVVICAYTDERWANLVAAVESLRQQTLAPLELVLVIDHNPTLFERACAAFDDASVLENTASRGLSGARNSGIDAAHGEVIAFLDDDAVATPTWVAQLAAGYDDPNVVGVGGSALPDWEQERPPWFPEEFDWVVGCTYRGMPETVAPVRNFIGANMSFRRSVFTSVGGFRTDVGQVGSSMLRCDDTEFCIRVRQQLRHAVLRYLPTAQVRHFVPSTRAAWQYFRTRCYTEGLAKAQVARLMGANDGLASERAYTLRTLPLGVLRNLGATLTDRNMAGVSRASAIIFGFGATALGYGVGQLAHMLGPRPKPIPAAVSSAGR